MERFFILDKFNTYYDWRLILTEKDVTPAEVKTHYVELDGMSGTIDLTEALAGEVTYKDRKITAIFWTDYGTRRDREKLLRDIRVALHGKKIKIIEPDDTEHYFYGRVNISSIVNNLAYAEFTLEATCDPWRYALNDSERTIEVNSEDVVNMVVYNNGIKSLSPVIKVDGSVVLHFNGSVINLESGNYQITDIKLVQGANVIGVSGTGSVTLVYKEAEI